MVRWRRRRVAVSASLANMCLHDTHCKRAVLSTLDLWGAGIDTE